MKSPRHAGGDPQGPAPERIQRSNPWEAPPQRRASNGRAPIAPTQTSPSSPASIDGDPHAVAVFGQGDTKTDDHQPSNPESALFADLCRAVTMISGHIERELLAPIGLTWTSYRLLHLVRGRRMDLCDVAVRLGVTLAEVGDIVSRLSARGQVDLSFGESGSEIMVEIVDDCPDVVTVLERVAHEERALVCLLPKDEANQVLVALNQATALVQASQLPGGVVRC